MNILHYANYGSPYKGNFVQSLLRLNDVLKSNNDKMFWLFEDNLSEYEWPNELIGNGIDISFMNAFNYKNYGSIRKFIVENEIEIVHLHFITLKVLITFNLAIKGMKNVKLCVHLHNHLPHDKAFLRKPLLKKAYFACCSESVAKSAISFGIDKNKVFVVENAIDFSRLDIVSNNKKILDLFDNSAFKILMFGFDYDRKGVDIVINALKPLVDRGENIHFYISVAANYDYVKKRIFEHLKGECSWITLLPPCNEVATYYKNVDAFISASREEGFCYALIEAAYCKTEVIASIIPAQRDLSISNCHWFQTENSNELGSIINNLYSTQKSDKVLEEQKQNVINKYDLDVWANSLFEFYHKI